MKRSHSEIDSAASASVTDPFVFDTEFPKLKNYINDFLSKCSNAEAGKVTDYLANLNKQAESSRLARSIQADFDAIVERWLKRSHENPNFEALSFLYQRAKCVGKEIEQADYHVISSISWEFQLPPTDATSESEVIGFECTYYGDDEGQGSYNWECICARDTSYNSCDVVLNPANKKHKVVLDKFGSIPPEEVNAFLSSMFECSFS
jgi:hypothetical protein